ncbi:MAG: DUF1800 domain-containing protein [Pirellulales bacterium]|nr:DUF1800 domain-containing protein [Pirellulales bacterium]
MPAFSEIDVAWAWAPYQPSEQVPWNMPRAAHLFRRAGFAASQKQLLEAVRVEPQQCVEDLVSLRLESESFRQQMSDLVRAAMGTGNVQQLAAQWTYRMLHTPVPLLEKMTLFWHGHFATSAAKVEDAKLMLAQNELLRRHALGDFNELLLEISRDPAMLIYLDSVSNRKAHPNENYAREIMELFALGEGNYSEQDIRELARCFTGWEIKREKFRFNRYQHDGGNKTVLGVSGKLGGEEGVQIVASQDSAPRFLLRKLVQFFLMDEPLASDSLIQPLAKQLRDDELRLEPTLRRILGSNLMFSAHVAGRKIRSPVELGIGFLRALEGSTDSFELAASFQRLGQGLYYPPSVKGWDGGRTWINSSTLLGRSNLIRTLMENSKTRFAKGTLAEYLREQGVRSADDLIHLFETLLFAVPIPAQAKERITQLYGTGGSEQRVREAVHALCTLPEFQLA